MDSACSRASCSYDDDRVSVCLCSTWTTRRVWAVPPCGEGPWCWPNTPGKMVSLPTVTSRWVSGVRQHARYVICSVKLVKVRIRASLVSFLCEFEYRMRWQAHIKIPPHPTLRLQAIVRTCHSTTHYELLFYTKEVTGKAHPRWAITGPTSTIRCIFLLGKFGNHLTSLCITCIRDSGKIIIFPRPTRSCWRRINSISLPAAVSHWCIGSLAHFFCNRVRNFSPIIFASVSHARKYAAYHQHLPPALSTPVFHAGGEQSPVCGLRW